MLRFLVITASFCLVRGDVGLQTYGTRCGDGNLEADRALANSNDDMNREGEDNVSVDFYGFKTPVGVYSFGLKLPVSVHLSVSHGNLTNAVILERCSNAVRCSTNTSNSLGSIYDYASDIGLSYHEATAKFLFWTVSGRLTFKPKPKIHMFLLNDTSSCRVETITVEEPDKGEYIFEYNKGTGWMGWLVSKLVVRGLEQEGSTRMVEQVELSTREMIGAYFVTAWCHPDWI